MADGQLVYIDESGDAGFKIDAGSTPTFIVGAVIFDCPGDAEATADRIHDYRANTLKKGRHFRFHFTNLRSDWRMGFLEAVSGCPFAVRAVVMQKERIWDGTQLKRNGVYFYKVRVWGEDGQRASRIERLAVLR